MARDPILLALLAAGGAALLALGCGKTRGDDDPPAAWRELAAGLEARPEVAAAEARLGASEVVFVEVEINHARAVAEGVTELDTGITPRLLAEAPHPVQLRITIPALEGRYWWGEYDAGTGRWVGIVTHAQAPSPDMEPSLRAETGTFVIPLPAEG